MIKRFRKIKNDNKEELVIIIIEIIKDNEKEKDENIKDRRNNLLKIIIYKQFIKLYYIKWKEMLDFPDTEQESKKYPLTIKRVFVKKTKEQNIQEFLKRTLFKRNIKIYFNRWKRQNKKYKQKLIIYNLLIIVEKSFKRNCFKKWKNIDDEIMKVIKDDNKKDIQNLDEEEISKAPKTILRGIKTKTPKGTTNIIELNEEEPVNRIIIQEEKDKLDLEKGDRKLYLIKNIILKRNLKRIFYHWYKVTIKIKTSSSCLDGIYGYCYTEHYTSYNYEFAPIHGNIESQDVSETIQPLFSDFLRNMNLSVAAFNLFTFYSQLRDKSILIKKKYLPHWRKHLKIQKATI